MLRRNLDLGDVNGNTRGMIDDDIQQPPLVNVPVWPILTPLLALWCGMLDGGILFSHLMTNGRYPSVTKLVVCTTITVILNAYCFWTARQHRQWRMAFRLVVKEELGRPAITIYQAGIVVAAVIGFSVLGAWAFLPIDA